MTIKFNTNGNDKQKQCARLWCDGSTEEVLYGGSKGSGKSYLGCALIAGDALLYPGTFYFIARKTLSDIVRYTMPSIYEVFGHWGLSDKYYTFNGQYNYFEFHNGSRIYLIDAKYLPSDPQYERFGSMQMTRGWIEEAGEFNRECAAALMASVGRWKNDTYGLLGKTLLTCNPSNNFLYSLFYQPWKKGTLPNYRAFVQALPADNKRLPAGYVEGLLHRFTQNQIERLVYGNWEYDDDPTTLVDYDAICDCFTNEHIAEEGVGYISTDLAGKGRDKWVVGSWKGFTVRLPIVQSFSEGKEMEVKLKQLAESLDIPRSRVVSDADGLGFYLESYMKGIREFHGGAGAINSNMYANLKSECAFKLADLVMKRQLRIICSEETAELIKQELGLLRAKNTNAAEQKRDLISKDTMKGLIGRSPDFLDVLIMRMVFEIKPPAKGMRTATYVTPDKR